MTEITKVLIANRGEIACRIIESVRDAGYRSVAIYSEADANARHVQLADEAVCVGPAQVSASYLNVENILSAAKITGADAVHPGYGFLSENAGFAKACSEAGLNFIGPSPDAIHLMGNKRVAKERMIEAGVPCIPGYQGADQSDKVLLKEAKGVGFPLMIKAAAGGGGRGMRFVQEGEDVKEALASARSESKNAFGSDELILELAIVDGRHIEIQVAADKAGNTVYLGERDCSIQRRHQKVIEEAPSPFVSPELRKQMGEAAVNAAKACQYFGVGTVEFLVDAKGAYYFLEMNTRLQVEHPVTELITGVDLVDWQLKIAVGENLPKAQDDIELNGHAIEARLYAEDPAAGFMPQTGPILAWEPAEGAGIRIDHGITSGGEVSPHYDPMLAKLIAFGATREEARRRLIRATEDTAILGVTTNKNFLVQLLKDQRFVGGEATTGLIDADVLKMAKEQAQISEASLALSGVLLLVLRSKAEHNPWTWGQTAGYEKFLTLVSGEASLNVSVKSSGADFVVQHGETQTVIELLAVADGSATFVSGGVRRSARYALQEDRLYLDSEGRSHEIEDVSYRPALSDDQAGSGQIAASTEGLVIGVAVSEGGRVEKGQLLVTIEAMKMEHRLVADGDGTVTTVSAQLNAQVKKGHIMIELELDENGGDQ
jgi:geranyl-CoA carboxylase alpha subunit